MGKIIFEDFSIDKLSKQQLNRFGKYFVATCFSGLGLDIFPDEKSSFFIFKKNDKEDIHVYVRTARPKKDISYSFVLKNAWKNELSKNVYVALVLIENNIPSIFLIPATAWAKPNALLVDRDYKGKKSLPEWGISTNQKNMELLKGYEIKKQLRLQFGWS